MRGWVINMPEHVNEMSEKIRPPAVELGRSGLKVSIVLEWEMYSDDMLTAFNELIKFLYRTNPKVLDVRLEFR